MKKNGLLMKTGQCPNIFVCVLKKVNFFFKKKDIYQ